MESFLVNYFRKQGNSKNLIKRLLVEVIFSIYMIILYVPLQILRGIYWTIEKLSGTKF